MGLDALLGWLEGRAVTPVTSGASADVTPKRPPIKACTSVTSVTSRNAVAANSDQAEARRQQVAGHCIQPVPTEALEFASSADLEAESEEIEERAAIIAEGCGLDQATALQEARWQLHRRRAWAVFVRNAERLLESPMRERETLLAVYRTEAAQRYGEETASNMVASLRNWVKARGLH